MMRGGEKENHSLKILFDVCEVCAESGDRLLVELICIQTILYAITANYIGTIYSIYPIIENIQIFHRVFCAVTEDP